MTVHIIDGRLGRIDRVTRDEQPALSRAVELDLAEIQAAWPEFERALDSLRGRKMVGLIYDHDGVYRLSTLRLDRDVGNPLGLGETTTPGGDYLRLRLIGEPPAIYGRIGDAFDELFEHADHDPGRPLIEYYHSEGQVHCLVPVR